jgi:hypothetical protein
MLKIVTIVAFSFCLSLATALSFSGNGSGTEEDPYQITNVHELQEMSDDLDAYYILMNDIDASETSEWNEGDHDGDPSTPDSAMGFEPVGNYGEYNPKAGFTGRLEGNNHSIFNLYINRPDEYTVGLFGCISDGGYVKNVNIRNAKVIGYYDVGIFAGLTFNYFEDNEVIVENCSCEGIVNGWKDVGGFCGSNYIWEGEISKINCNATVSVYGSFYVGGFCGYNQTVHGTTNIFNSTSTGNVIGNDNYIGGFCGTNHTYTGTSITKNCLSTGNVVGNERVGGFCGSNYALSGSSNIIDSYSTGSVEGYVNVGGFCGSNTVAHYESSRTLLRNCYALGNVKGHHECVGGFVGYNLIIDGTSTISDCYATGDASGQNYVGGLIGYNNIAPNFTHGSSSLNECYATGDVSGQNYVGGLVGANKVKLKRYSGEIVSLSIINCYALGDVLGTNDYIGGFSGYLDNNNSITEITYCYATGATSGRDKIGGFCGYNLSNSGTSTIKYSKATGSVSGNYYVGGFCGYNVNSEGAITIENSYASGSAFGNRLVGGFCGRNYAKSGSAIIINCYSLGQPSGSDKIGGFCGHQFNLGIGEIISCYYDTQTSGTTESDGGEGKTTAEMMMQSTFENWDFDNVWCMGEHETYPQLQHFVDCDTLVSVPDTELNSEIRLYPNPTDNALHIEFDTGLIHSPEIAIYNLLGQVVFSDLSADITQPYKVNTGNFSPGIYFCKVSGIGISEVRSFVVYR